MTAPLPITSDGVIFNNARGDPLLSKWSIPADASLVPSASMLDFNWEGPGKNVIVRLNNLAGTQPYKACFEDNWEIDTTTDIMSSFTGVDQHSFKVGFVDGVGRFYGARIQSHPAAANQVFAVLEVSGSEVGSTPTGYVYSVGDTVRVRARRNGNKFYMTINWNGGADITVEREMSPIDSSGVERPRLFSTPVIIFNRGAVRTHNVKVSHGGFNAKVAFATTSLGDGRFTASYDACYTQLIKAAHAGEVLVCAAPGATSADWLQALPELIATGAKEIVFEIYANDVAISMPNGVPLQTIINTTMEIYLQCVAAGVTPRFFNAPPHNWYAGSINDWLPTTSLDWFDIFTLLVSPTGNGFTLKSEYWSDAPAPQDGLHLGTAGNLAIAGPVDAWLVAEGTFGDPQSPPGDPVGVTLLAGAGTGASIVSYQSSGNAGSVSIMTGSNPVAGPVFAVEYDAAYANHSHPVLYPGNNLSVGAVGKNGFAESTASGFTFSVVQPSAANTLLVIHWVTSGS